MSFFTELNESFERGRERARKESNIKRVVSMINDSKSDEDVQKVVDFMNKNGITCEDVHIYLDKNKKLQWR